MNNELKPIPTNIDAEKSVLGSAIVLKDAIGIMTSLLKNNDFYIDKHGIIYDAICTIDEANAVVDLVTLTEELGRKDNLEKIGGTTYLTELINSVPSASNAEYYAKIVRGKSTLRGLITACDEIKMLSYEGAEEADKIVGSAEEIIFSVTEERKIGETKKIKEYIPKVLEELEYVHKHKGQLPPSCLHTPFTKLNNVLSIPKGEYVIVAGRPSMGKSAFVHQLLNETTVKYELPVILFSLEMGRESVIKRLLCQYARLDGHKINRGWIKEGDWTRLIQASGKIGAANFYIDDTAGISPYEIRNKCRKLQRLHPDLALIVVDYIQLSQLPRPTANRNNDITTISSTLKNLAQELKVPLIGVSQLNRGVEHREDKRPLMSDLRESGSLEQDADSVLMFYREGYYNKDAIGSIAEVIIRKQRNGPVGITTELFWTPESTRFDNLEAEDEPFTNS